MICLSVLRMGRKDNAVWALGSIVAASFKAKTTLGRYDRRTMRSRAIVAVLAFVALPCAAQRDPIEGRWAGRVGRPTDRPDIALEIKRDSVGKLRAYLYLFAFHGTPIGEVVRSGSTYDVSDL